MSEVVVLRPNEMATVDIARVTNERDALGEAEAERRIGTALEELALHLSCIGMAVRQEEPEEMLTRAREAAEVASELGLDRLARVARTVCALTNAQDPAALGANLARLMRLGDAALSQMWDLQDQRG